MIDHGFWPPLLALSAAFLFALSTQFQNIGLDGADPRSAALTNILTGALLYWGLAPLYLDWSWWFAPATFLFVLVGIFRPPLSLTLNIMAIRTMGPTLASAFASTAPLFAAAFAIGLLGERLTPEITLATCAIVAGAIIATLKPAGLKRDWPVWAVALPLMTACIRAGAHAVTKLGLNEIPSPMFASLVGYTVGAAVTAAAFAAEGRRYSGGFRSHKWFILSGVLSGIGILCLNTGLQLGTVLTVAPIVAASPVFTLALSLFVFRRETVTWRTVSALILVCSGVMLLIIRR